MFSVNLSVFLFLYRGRDARWANSDLIPTRHMPGHPGHPGGKEADRIWFGKDRAGETSGAVLRSSISPGRTWANFSSGVNLRQSLPAAGIIEESESARGERGRVGQGRVGFRV